MQCHPAPTRGRSPQPEAPALNQLLDFLPILVFAVVYFTVDLYAATAALMIAVSLQILLFWLLVSKFIVKKDLLQKMLGQQLELPEKAWVHLNCGWAAAFFLAAALNLFVAYNFSMDIWVSYKLIGGFGLTFCYIIITMIYLQRGGYLEALEAAEVADPKPGNDSP